MPAAAGVAQLLGPDGRNLLIGRPANLRRWAATQLGRGKPVPKGKRPPTDLSTVAEALGYVVTTSAFRQRLFYERLMAQYVPLSKRRDLKPSAFLHLDPAERFPRLSVRRLEEDRGVLYGPFRDRKAADKARDAFHKRHPLRPCDYVFEPDPALPLGLGCIYAQVRTCAAPCLERIEEEDYRAMAAQVVVSLANPDRRSPDPAVPDWISRAAGRGVVVARGASAVEIFPIKAGRVLESNARVVEGEDWEASVADLEWDDEAGERAEDWPWLVAWLSSPAGKGAWRTLPTP